AEHSDCSDLVCIEEFAIYGRANRADVAALNGLSHGYEIKSDRDTLDRLPGQIEAYGAIFERATLVSTSKHLGPAKRLIPKWWGIVEVEPLNDGRSLLHRSREAKINPSLQSRAVASLL